MSLARMLHRGSAGRPPRHAAMTLVLAGVLACAALHVSATQAQGRRGAAAGPPGPPPPAEKAAPFDSSGYWVSLITEAWHYRMIVPGPGDYDEIPLSLAGKEFADAFNAKADEAAGKACEAYGAPVLLWVPTRLHISWADENTLRVETDAGMQTRLLRFKPSEHDKMQPPSLQGVTTAQWVIHGAGGFGGGRNGGAPGAGPRYGYIKATTTDLLPGLLRKNGIPYGGKTTSMTEYWEQHSAPGGSQWLIVTTVLHDPVYLADPYVFSPTFRKEPDGSKWDPQPCSLTW
jgi:hypothetical protein